MFSKRAVATLSKTERHALRRQWIQSGQCVRCFSASTRILAQEKDDAKGNDNGTPYNAPARGPSRQQRAAMISEEVKMIHRNAPAPTLAERDPNTDRPPGASKTFDPQAVGQNMPPGRMGENDFAGREGPAAQNVGSSSKSDVDIVDRSVSPSMRTNTSPIGNPENVKGGVVESTSGLGPAAKTTAFDETEADDEIEEGEEDADDNSETWSSEKAVEARKTHMHSGRNVSTIASANFEGVVEDRLRLLAEPGQREGYRDASYLAAKMMKGQMVRFESQAEKAEAEAEARKITERRAERYAKQKKIGADAVQPTPLDHTFAAVPQAVRTSLMDKMVAGKYDADGLLQGKQKYKQPVLNDVAKILLKNGTYLNDEGNRLLRKVQSLLPAVQATQQQAGKQKPTQKAA